MLNAEQRARRRHGYESPRSEVQTHVPLGARRILELGCSTGALGAALKHRQGAYVVGVEPDREYAAQARSKLDRVVVSDAAAFLLAPRDEAPGFDCLIAADVLEHLVDPWGVLEGAVDLLDPGATVIISLPNVLEWRGLWRIVRAGRWPRDDQGVFDRTHLRWFTRIDALEMLRAAGLQPVNVEPRYWQTGWHLIWRRMLARTWLGRFLPAQYVISAVKPG